MPDTRFGWPVILDLLDVLERAGYKRGDGVHTARAVALLWDAARVYAGELDEPEAVPAVRTVIRGLEKAEAARAAAAVPAAVTLGAAQYEVVARALADAETFLRERAGTSCEACVTGPAGACPQHLDDLDDADEYRQAADEIAQEMTR